MKQLFTLFINIKQILKKMNYIKEIYLLILLFILGMYIHTIKAYLIKWLSLPTHNIFWLSLFIFILHLAIISEEYRPFKRKILILQLKYEMLIFLNVTLPKIVINTKKRVKAFFIKYW